MVVFDLEFEEYDSDSNESTFSSKLPRTQPEVTIIDTQTALADLVDTLSNLPTSPPSLYLDLEGENLGRKGTIAILQLHLLPTHHTYLIDVHTLQHATFTTTGHSGTTLKSVLESATIPKVFFDVRHDSDALYHLYGVSLAGIKDLQLMKHATYSDTRYVKGLATCIQWDAGLATSELHAAWAVKEAGKKLFCPELGGSYAVFSQRPLLDDIIRYCAQDAYILPLLYERYDWLINREHFATYFRETIARHEKMRVKDSQSEYFASWGKDHFIRAPGGKGWDPVVDLKLGCRLPWGEWPVVESQGDASKAKSTVVNLKPKDVDPWAKAKPRRGFRRCACLH